MLTFIQPIAGMPRSGASLERLEPCEGKLSRTVLSALTNDPVVLLPSPVGGFEPLTVSFTTKVTLPGKLKRLLYDFDGNGAVDKETHDLRSVTNTYATSGEWFPFVTVETTYGRFASATWGSWFSSGSRGGRSLYC
jgi:hypothetical protein